MVLKKSRVMGSYIRDTIFAANDGVITTFAIIAGAQGAGLSSSVVIIMGFANLIADGFSMANGNYQGIKSEMDYDKANHFSKKRERNLVIHPALTFFGFIAAGLFPLVPYILQLPNSFEISLFLVAVCLFGLGWFRAFVSNKEYFKEGSQTLLVGGFAAAFAYFVGDWLDRYLGA